MSSPKATTAAAAATPAKSTAVVRYTSPSGSTSSASSSRRSSNSGSYTQNSRSYTQSSYSYPQSSYGYAQSSYSYPQSSYSYPQSSTSTSTSSPTTMAVAPTCRHPMSMTASAPNCVYCGDPTERFVTRASNRNGNAGRPYYKCVPCKKFAVFADERGNSPNNPPCEGCGMPSKRQVAGRNSTVPGGIHYVCSQGTCDFYQPHVDRSGVQAAVLDPDLLKALINLNLV